MGQNGIPRAVKIVIDEGDVGEILGPVKHFPEVAERTARSGVATGLAWTPVGGDILFIEATAMPGHGKLIIEALALIPYNPASPELDTGAAIYFQPPPDL